MKVNDTLYTCMHPFVPRSTVSRSSSLQSRTMVSSFSSIPVGALRHTHRRIFQALLLTCAFWLLCNLIFLHRQLPVTAPVLQRQTNPQVRDPTANYSTVLIVGVARFLGYSAALRLLRANLSKVIGIDSFLSHTGSPSLELKYKRADILSHYRGINISRGDVCDSYMLKGLFQRNNFTHIFYFASEEEKEEAEKQPSRVHESSRRGDGGRNNSLERDDLCFLTLLEELRTLEKSPRLIYQSSSTSVRVQSAYTREKLANLYSEQFRVPSIAWRLPIVFGPYGDSNVLSLLLDCQFGEGTPTAMHPHTTVMCNNGFAYIHDIMHEIPRVMKIKSSHAKINSPIVSSRRHKSADDLRRDLKFTLEWISYDSGIKHLCASECLPDDGHQISCIASSFDAAAESSSILSQGCDTVVYTVAFTENASRRIHLHEPEHGLFGAPQKATSCYFAFVNRPILPQEQNISRWVFIQLPSWSDIEDLLGDNRRKGKFLKFHPLKFFAPSVSWAIYIDAKLQLLAEPRDMIRTQRSPEMGSRRAVLVAVRHPLNEDPFKEAADIRFLKAKYRNELSFSLWTMEHQLQNYYEDMQRYNLPLNNMIDSAILIHDLRSAEATDFRCAWSREYYRRADRDQLAFPWVLASKVREAGAPDLVPRQEWCPVGGENMAYIRILPDKYYHWWKTREWAVDLGLAFVDQPSVGSVESNKA